MPKRILSLILSLLLLTQLGLLAAFAYDEDGFMITDGVRQRLAQIMDEYPDGSFFTVTGYSCEHSKWGTCSNCALTSVKPELKGKVNNAWTCVGFSRYVFYTVFGIDDYGISGKCPSVELDEARSGDLVRFSGHDAIFLYKSGDRYYCLESNYGSGGTNVVTFSSESRSESQMARATIYRATNYDEVMMDTIAPIDVVYIYEAPERETEEPETDETVTPEPELAGDSVFVFNKERHIISDVPEGTLSGELIANLDSNIVGKFTVYDFMGDRVANDEPLCGGMMLSVDNGSVIYNYVISIKNDVDGDGQVTVADARHALRSAIGMFYFSDWQQAAVDLAGDEKVTPADARNILLAAVGIN